jgi:hypothetical protein
MKATLYAAGLISSIGLNAFNGMICSTAYAVQPAAATPQSPFEPVQPNPSAQEVLEFLSPRSSSPAAGIVAAGAQPMASQAVPAARIRVVDSASLNRPATSASGLRSATAVPTARIRVVDEAIDSKMEVEAPTAVEPAAANADAEAAVVAATIPEASAPIDPAFAKLVGTWKAIARYGDGELTTVELQLDERGWAAFTVPSVEGQPSTIKRRAKLNGEELKLTGPDTNLLLGKLIEVTKRQMVLARAEGKLTFVRPQEE